MKLLIVTQAVDRHDPILGFFHRWIEEFAKHAEKVTVICLREGEHDLPKNVVVFSLGKEKLPEKIMIYHNFFRRLGYILNFYRYVWRTRHEYESVFVHMNPEYMILGGVLWRLWGKRIGLWYVHRARTVTMRMGSALAHAVFTSAKKSFGKEGPKVHVVGHGIDTKLFSGLPLSPIDVITPRLLFVGRVSPIKRIEICISALAHLRERGVTASLDIYGAPLVKGDLAYERELRALVQKLKLGEHVTFLGNVENSRLPEIYAAHSALINTSPTGGIDKVVLEAMASGLPVFVCNHSFQEYLSGFSDDLIAHDDAEGFADRIHTFFQRHDIRKVQESMRVLAFQKADISKLIPAIIELYGPGR